MKNDIVLNFYSKLPFNIKEGFDINASCDVNGYHPSTLQLARECRNVFDIGCGPGHLINAIAMKMKSKFRISNIINKVNSTGIDFNPTAIEYAKKYAIKHRLQTNFIIRDILDLNSDVLKQKIIKFLLCPMEYSIIQKTALNL